MLAKGPLFNEPVVRVPQEVADLLGWSGLPSSQWHPLANLFERLADSGIAKLWLSAYTIRRSALEGGLGRVVAQAAKGRESDPDSMLLLLDRDELRANTAGFFDRLAQVVGVVAEDPKLRYKSLAELNVMRILSPETLDHRTQHAKLMLIEVKGGITVALAGSSNPTTGGLSRNWELNFMLAWRGGLPSSRSRSTPGAFDPFGLVDAFASRWKHCSRALDPNVILRMRPPDYGLPLKPFDWQDDLIQELLEKWELAPDTPRPTSELRGITLRMPTGTGKTLVTAEFIKRLASPDRYPGLRVLWLAHLGQLLGQAKRTLQRQGQLEVQEWEPTTEVDTPCVLVTTDRGCHKAIEDYGNQRFDLVVVDEVHRYGSKTYVDIFSKLSARMVIGLSATPYRSRGDHLLVKQFPRGEKSGYHVSLDATTAFNDCHGLDGRPVLPEVRHLSVPTGWKMRIKPKGSTVPLAFQLVQQEQAAIREFAQHFSGVVAVTHQLLAEHLGQEGGLGPTLVFAAHKEQAEYLRRAFQALEGYHWIEVILAEYHDRGGQRDVIQKFERAARSDDSSSPILIGVDLVAEGLDLPFVKTLLMARPTTSMRLYDQMLGRGLRGPGLENGTETCNVVHFGAQLDLDLDDVGELPSFVTPLELLDPQKIGSKRVKRCSEWEKWLERNERFLRAREQALTEWARPRKRATKKKAAATRKRPTKCKGKTASGTKCKNFAQPGNRGFCGVTHPKKRATKKRATKKKAAATRKRPTKCKGKTASGTKCKNFAQPGNR
ncbi:MAG: DEAD/DEAH box helicase family protein, partial [Planctomycetes bacterium]|nr:DEAD/DEAH box helicase family protein [Planctomycetota bacterium]